MHETVNPLMNSHTFIPSKPPKLHSAAKWPELVFLSWLAFGLHRALDSGS